jgi:hypothetical protein
MKAGSEKPKGFTAETQRIAEKTERLDTEDTEDAQSA